jgi:DNA-directed RNA polymerase subunit RPC12/RpoP
MELIVMRLADMERIHPNQDNSHVCSKCGQQVGIYPSGQMYLKERPNLDIICSRCAGAFGVVVPPSQQIITEMQESIRKKDV